MSTSPPYSSQFKKIEQSAADQLRAHLEKHQREENEKIAKDMIDSMIKINSSVYSDARTYANVILVAAYAGLFTIWSFTKSYLPEKAIVSIALMLCFSILVFALFETIKVFVAGNNMLRFGKVLKVGLSPEEINRFVKEYTRNTNRQVIATSVIWYIVYFMSLISAAGAGGLLTYNFVANLLHMPFWPA